MKQITVNNFHVRAAINYWQFQHRDPPENRHFRWEKPRFRRRTVLEKNLGFCGGFGYRNNTNANQYILKFLHANLPQTLHKWTNVGIVASEFNREEVVLKRSTLVSILPFICSHA